MTNDLRQQFQISEAHSSAEAERRAAFEKLFQTVDIPISELLTNPGLFIRRQVWARLLFMHHLYCSALTVHGVVMDFGTRWGQNMALFSSFRGIYEPHNYSRKLIGFDTFSGFPSVSALDGENPAVSLGGYGVSADWESVLEQILDYHESESPISHIRKFDVIKGDVAETLPAYLKSHPETIVAFAYFDFDLYQPTIDALRAIKPYLTRGSVLGFDELNEPDFPGETIAVREALGLDSIQLRRVPYSPLTSYIVWEG